MSTATLQHATAGTVGLDRATPQRRTRLPGRRSGDVPSSPPPASTLGQRPAARDVPIPRDSPGTPPRTASIPANQKSTQPRNAPFFGEGGPAEQPGILPPLSSAILRR